MKTYKEFMAEEDKLKNKVLKLLIKYGNNKNDAQKLIDANFDTAVKSYPDARASKLADIVSTL